MRDGLLYSCLLVAGLSVLGGSGAAKAEVRPLPRAHAHNDYHHQSPLHDALAHGFCSVEADVFLVDGKLLVGHDESELRRDRTLERLYLEPLRERIRRNRGHVFDAGSPFRLLVDVKSDAADAYPVLDQVLASYKEILTRVEHGRTSPGPVLVVISGNRDRQAVSTDDTRYAGIDGRLSDLGSDSPPELLPWISDRWPSHFTWDGTGEMPAAEREKLDRIVRQAHREGRTVRFWATPESPALWKLLVDADVDLINTDDLPGLRNFLLESTD